MNSFINRKLIKLRKLKKKKNKKKDLLIKEINPLKNNLNRDNIHNRNMKDKKKV